MTSLAPVSMVTPLPPVVGAAGEASAATASSSAAPASGLALNPDVVIKPSLGIAVIEWFGKTGDVLRSLPSARELAAYAAHGLPGEAHDDGASDGAPFGPA